MTQTILHGGRSHPGKVRQKNEDRWVADPMLGLYVVVDGMGGRMAGEVAAEIVAQTLPQQVRERLAEVTCIDDAVAATMQNLLSELSDTLVQQTQHELGLEGLGATVVVLLVKEHQALVAHLGDSRAYLQRDGTLRRLTVDHTLVQLLLDRQEISAEEASDHPARHQITRFVGMSDSVLADVKILDILPGDRLLLCTDGLTGMVEDVQLQSTLAEPLHPDAICERLIAAANDAGGCDNITAVVVDVVAATATLKTNAASVLSARGTS